MKGDGGVKSEGSSIISRCVRPRCLERLPARTMALQYPYVTLKCLRQCLVYVHAGPSSRRHSYRILGFPRAVGGYTCTVPSGQSCGLVLPYGEPRCMGGAAARAGTAIATTTTAEAALTPTTTTTTGTAQHVLFASSSLRRQIDNDPCVCVGGCVCV